MIELTSYLMFNNKYLRLLNNRRSEFTRIAMKTSVTYKVFRTIKIIAS